MRQLHRTFQHAQSSPYNRHFSDGTIGWFSVRPRRGVGAYDLAQSARAVKRAVKKDVGGLQDPAFAETRRPYRLPVLL
ncbi:MAG TPA: hypothetical protein VK937_01855 [Candidatus Limnocylindria bacterium]|nr:hypothetical protein [Candidatus Limnocylindria bacterium]